VSPVKPITFDLQPTHNPMSLSWRDSRLTPNKTWRSYQKENQLNNHLCEKTSWIRSNLPLKVSRVVI